MCLESVSYTSIVRHTCCSPLAACPDLLLTPLRLASQQGYRCRCAVKQCKIAAETMHSPRHNTACCHAEARWLHLVALRCTVRAKHQALGQVPQVYRWWDPGEPGAAWQKTQQAQVYRLNSPAQMEVTACRLETKQGSLLLELLRHDSCTTPCPALCRKLRCNYACGICSEQAIIMAAYDCNESHDNVQLMVQTA